MSDTPRTDAASKWYFSESGQMQTICVSEYHAQCLERELNAALECIRRIATHDEPYRNFAEDYAAEFLANIPVSHGSAANNSKP